MAKAAPENREHEAIILFRGNNNGKKKDTVVRIKASGKYFRLSLES